MRQTEIYRKKILAGILTEDGGEYRFCHDKTYLAHEDAQPVSLTHPLQTEAFVSPVLFSFFDGLIPEGRLLDVALRNNDISIFDRMSLLLLCCKECLGFGSIVGDRTKHLGKKGEWGHDLNVSNDDNIRIEGITIKDFWGDCIYVRGNNKVLISNCKIQNGRRQRISVTQCKNNITKVSQVMAHLHNLT